MRLSSVLLVAAMIAGCAEAPVKEAPAPRAAAALAVPTEILKPDGNGPFPAVVMLHDCSGLGPRGGAAPRRWAKELQGRGYVVAMPDSFSTRGHPGGVCTNASPDRAEVGPVRRVPDAYSTLEHLRSLPFVDPKRVGVMGGSHGGATTLNVLAVDERDSAALAEAKRGGFRAGIALYPGCGNRPAWRTRYVPVAPLLILSGELDDWTPAKPCEQLAANAAAAGHPVSIKVYPGAHHSFDGPSPIRHVEARVNSNSPTGRGATTGGNPEAWADSIRQVAAFFEKHLR